MCLPRYEIMSQCWREDPSQRATFSSLRSDLEHLLSQNSAYLILDGTEPAGSPPRPPPPSSDCPLPGLCDEEGIEEVNEATAMCLTETSTRCSIQQDTKGVEIKCKDETLLKGIEHDVLN